MLQVRRRVSLVLDYPANASSFHFWSDVLTTLSEELILFWVILIWLDFKARYMIPSQEGAGHRVQRSIYLPNGTTDCVATQGASNCLCMAKSQVWSHHYTNRQPLLYGRHGVRRRFKVSQWLLEPSVGPTSGCLGSGRPTTCGYLGWAYHPLDLIICCPPLMWEPSLASIKAQLQTLIQTRWHKFLPLCASEQARKARRCDSNLQSETMNDSFTDWPTDWQG